MSVTRQKVEDDPLTMFMNNPHLENNFKPESEPQPAPKPRSDAARVSEPAALPKHLEVKKVCNDFTAGVNADPASAAIPPVLQQPRVPSIDDDEPIFGREAAPMTGDDLFQGVDINKNGKGSHLLRLGNEKIDEDELNDLKVNKLLEEETDLDYEMFGTSDVTMNGHVRPLKSPSKAAVIGVLDDIDLNNSLIDLDIKEPDSNIFSPAINYTAALPSETAPSTASARDFDINAYIKSQAEDSGGGLFD